MTKQHQSSEIFINSKEWSAGVVHFPPAEARVTVTQFRSETERFCCCWVNPCFTEIMLSRGSRVSLESAGVITCGSNGLPLSSAIHLICAYICRSELGKMSLAIFVDWCATATSCVGER